MKTGDGNEVFFVDGVLMDPLTDIQTVQKQLVDGAGDDAAKKLAASIVYSSLFGSLMQIVNAKQGRHTYTIDENMFGIKIATAEATVNIVRNSGSNDIKLEFISFHRFAIAIEPRVYMPVHAISVDLLTSCASKLARAIDMLLRVAADRAQK